MRIRGDDFEGFGDLLGVGASTDIKEVGRVSAVELDDVHGGHGQTRSVDQAANGALEPDVVEAGLGGGDLTGILLGVVSELKHILLPEICVVIKVDLGIHAGNCRRRRRRRRGR